MSNKVINSDSDKDQQYIEHRNYRFSFRGAFQLTDCQIQEIYQHDKAYDVAREAERTAIKATVFYPEGHFGEKCCKIYRRIYSRKSPEQLEASVFVKNIEEISLI